MKPREYFINYRLFRKGIILEQQQRSIYVNVLPLDGVKIDNPSELLSFILMIVFPVLAVLLVGKFLF